jgi:signal peptidase I
MAADGRRVSNPYTSPQTTQLDLPPLVRPWASVALLLAIVTTGGGYYYCGARWRLVAVALLTPFLFLLLALLMRAGLPAWTLAAFWVFYLLVWIDTFRQARRPDALRPRWPDLAGALLLCWMYFAGASALFRGFVLASVYVPAASMAPALEVGDHFIADKISYLGGEPQRGDIALFRLPDDPSVNYLKRIIGVPGDVVTITPEGEVEINGSRLPLTSAGTYRDAATGDELSQLREETGPDRSYLILRIDPYRSVEQTWRVPEDAYFVLGDNRDNSKDSRRWMKSYVPRDHLIGRAVYIHGSRDPQTGWPRWARLGSLGERVELPAETPEPGGS